MKIIYMHIIAWMLFITSCSRVTYSYCDRFENMDSLIQRIVVDYDEDAYEGLRCCFYDDCNIDLYGFLMGDSLGKSGYYAASILPDGNNVYGLSDTVVLYYHIKGIVMGSYILFNFSDRRDIEFPDSIYQDLFNEFKRWFYDSKPPIPMRKKYAKEYSNLDSLCKETLTTGNLPSYEILRQLVPYDSLQPISLYMANRFHYPTACYDVYRNSIRGYRLKDADFQFAYQYLCEAADSMYYPAVFLKAGLCLTGAYFPPDTILGKQLLSQCQGTAIVPFWQQCFKPVPYLQLMRNP